MFRKGPRFTEAARAAAAITRRDKAGLAAQNFNVPSVYVLRAAEPGEGYQWEIRKFGGVPLERSASCYESIVLAREEGAKALERLREQIVASSTEGPNRVERSPVS